MKTPFAASFVVALSFLAPPALAQSAPGAGLDIAALSSDLQNSRNSAASIQAQAEEIRQLKALVARESQTPAAPDAAPVSDKTEDPAAGTGDVMIVIPTGNGLVPARNNRATPLAKAERIPHRIDTNPNPDTDRN